MEKRVFLATTLSFLVLIFWSKWFYQPQVIEEQKLTKKNPFPISSFSLEKPFASTEIKFSSQNLEFIFEEETASIKRINFQDYPNSFLILNKGFLLSSYPFLKFKKIFSSSEEIVFKAEYEDKNIIKKFIFLSPYRIRLELNVQNNSPSSFMFSTPLILSSLDISENNPETKFYNIGIFDANNLYNFSPFLQKELKKIKTLIIKEKYFCLIVEPKEIVSGYLQKKSKQEAEISINVQSEILPQNSLSQIYEIYIGPQDIEKINNVNPDWTFLINPGIISQIILSILKFLYSIVHNWGIAIILLSVLIYFIFFPLSLKQLKTTKQLQQLQPKIEELRILYKDNPQKLNKELMELYKYYKINPLGGCLPLILQLPIFFALYQTLLRSIQLKGAKFLWIRDLSEPDQIMKLPFSLPFLGEQLNILPLFLLILMMLQQKFSSVSSSEQKIFIYLFSFIFLFIFYFLPSGLVLYWLVNSILSLIFQVYITKNERKK